MSESIEDNMVFNAMQIKREYLYDFKLFSFRNNKKIAEFADQMIHEFDIRCVGPVSYTHLDVYKRQEFSWGLVQSP